jgi:hypothetical protein
MADEDEKGYDEEVDVVDEEHPAGRGRGSRGGYRGGRGGSTRGRGRGGLRDYQVKNEFEGEDDDDVYSAPVNKPKRNVQKQADLKMDEDNYPAL